MSKTEFTTKMLVAVRKAQGQGAQINAAVVCAQAALESDWGRSGLCVRANNLFGIKAGSKWRGKTLDLPTKEWSKTRGWYKTVARWCIWDNWTDCIVYYGNMLQRLSWFRDALEYTGNADKFLEALLPEEGQLGWATDLNYFNKVRRIGAEIEKLGGPKWD